MPDAASIMAQYGLVNTDAAVTAAFLEGVDIAIAATVLEMESGGRNIWGNDTSVTGGWYTPGGPVTRENYGNYHAAMLMGHIPRNGCGPCQCTSAQYQDTADDLGGCYDPVANIRSGLRGLNALIKAYGVQLGAQHYNGSGVAAQNYGQKFLANYHVWSARLAGATTGDVLTPEQNQMLAELHGQACSLLKPWLGGVSDKEPSNPEDPNVAGYNLLQYVLRNNVEIHRTRVTLAELSAKVDALAAKLNALPAALGKARAS